MRGGEGRAYGRAWLPPGPATADEPRAPPKPASTTAPTTTTSSCATAPATAPTTSRQGATGDRAAGPWGPLEPSAALPRCRCRGPCLPPCGAQCLLPPVDPESLAEDEGWLCPACDRKIDMCSMINDEFGTGARVQGAWVREEGLSHAVARDLHASS